MIKVRKSEKPKVAAQGVPPHEPPMMRRRAGSTPPEKTLGEHLLASFEKLEAEEVEKVKEIAAKAKTTPQPKARSKLGEDTTNEDVKDTRPRVHGNQRHRRTSFRTDNSR